MLWRVQGLQRNPFTALPTFPTRNLPKVPEARVTEGMEQALQCLLFAPPRWLDPPARPLAMAERPNETSPYSPHDGPHDCLCGEGDRNVSEFVGTPPHPVCRHSIDKNLTDTTK